MIGKICTWIRNIIKWGIVLWLIFDLIAGGVRIILFNNFYNNEQKMVYLYRNYNCGLPLSNYDLIKKDGGKFEKYEDTFLYLYTIKINSSKYLYVMNHEPKDAGGWMVIDKKNRQKYFFDIDKNNYKLESGKWVNKDKNKDIEQQLSLTLDKIGKKMNYQFQLF